MFSVWRFGCFPLSKGDDTFWFGSKTVGMDEFSWFVWFARVPVVFVFKKINIFVLESLSSRVDGRSYLQSGAIDGSEANRIIHDSKLEFENSRFTPRRRIGFHMKLVQGAMPICEGSCRLTSLERQEVWNDCRSCKVRVGLNDDRGVNEGREDVREVFQQRGSGAKRKLSRCGRNQMGNESILALPEGAGDFVVYYDARSKDLEACLEKRRRLTNRWLSMKKDIASCGSKYLAYSEVEVEYQGSSAMLRTSMVDFRGNWNTHFREMSFSLRWGLSFEYGCASFEAWLWVVEGLTLERCSTFGKKDKLEPSYVGPFEILGWIGPIVRLKIYVLWAEYRKLDWEFLFDELRVKVRWDSKRGPELTWERKDQMRSRELKRNGNVMVGSDPTHSKSNWRVEIILHSVWFRSEGNGLPQGMISRPTLEDSRNWQSYVQLWCQILRNLWKSSSGDYPEVFKEMLPLQSRKLWRKPLP
ncbi:hypothetical protein Tco_1562727 [Tanacetum coccineum]